MPASPAGLGSPSPQLAAPHELVESYERRLDHDPQWADENLYLRLWLTRDPALAERAATRVCEWATSLAGPNNDALEHHTWCIATRGLRAAAFATWIDAAGLWPTSCSKTQLADDLLAFTHRHALAVLAGRCPSADNQYLSLSLSCAVIGEALSRMKLRQTEATKLRDLGVERVWRWLGLMPTEGYGGEGSSYQVQVVGPLVMWADMLLRELEGPDVTERTVYPNGCSFMTVLDLAHDLLSPGDLLPGWDNPGWIPYSFGAPLVYRALLRNEPPPVEFLLRSKDSYDNIAWGHDDRMWALLCWPASNTAATQRATPRQSLTGWVRPHVAAALDHTPTRSRLMLCADQTSESTQAIGRWHCNPNHLLYEVAGCPIFGDGGRDGTNPPPRDTASLAARLLPAQRQMIERQFGSLQRYLDVCDMGTLGRSNSVVVDEQRDWFPLTAKVGRCVWQHIDEEWRGFGFDSTPIYDPNLRLTAARRFILMRQSDGAAWVIDDYRATLEHDFGWQVHLPPFAQIQSNLAMVTYPSGAGATLAWPADEPAQAVACPDFPMPVLVMGQSLWPKGGSLRLQGHRRATNYRFATLLLPGLFPDAHVESLAEGRWRGRWRGQDWLVEIPDLGDARTPGDEATITSSADEPAWLCDESADAVQLVKRLHYPDPANWRDTVHALRQLACRHEPRLGPLALTLLRDTNQRYHVHSAACYCLGVMRYEPARIELEGHIHNPEPNIAVRAAAALRILDTKG